MACNKTCGKTRMLKLSKETRLWIEFSSFLAMKPEFGCIFRRKQEPRQWQRIRSSSQWLRPVLERNGPSAEEAKRFHFDRWQQPDRVWGQGDSGGQIRPKVPCAGANPQGCHSSNIFVQIDQSCTVEIESRWRGRQLDLELFSSQNLRNCSGWSATAGTSTFSKLSGLERRIMIDDTLISSAAPVFFLRQCHFPWNRGTFPYILLVNRFFMDDSLGDIVQ